MPGQQQNAFTRLLSGDERTRKINEILSYDGSNAQILSDGEMEYSYMIVKSSRLYSLKVEDMSIRTSHGQKYTSLVDEVAMASDGVHVHIMLESGEVLIYDQYRKQIEGIESDFLSVFDTTYVGVHSVKRVFLDDEQLIISNYNVYAIDEEASSDERTSILLEATFDENAKTRKTYQNGAVVGGYIIFGTVTDTYDDDENIISSVVGAEVYKKSDFSLYQTIDDLPSVETMAIIKGFTATAGNDGFIIKWSNLNGMTMHITEYRLKPNPIDNPETADSLYGYAIGVLVLGGTTTALVLLLSRRR